MEYSADSLKKRYEAEYKEQRKKNLIELREEVAQLTLSDFSKQIGIQKSNLSNLEHGDRDLSLFHIQAYKTYFKEKHDLNISADYLLGYSQNKYSNEDYQMISRVTGLNDSAIDCLKYLQSEQTRVYGTSILNTLMKEKKNFSALLGNIGIMLDKYDWDRVIAILDEDTPDYAEYRTLSANAYPAFARKDSNGKYDTSLVLDTWALKDIAYLTIKNILDKYQTGK